MFDDNEISTLRATLGWFIHDSNRSGRPIRRPVAEVYRRLEHAYNVSVNGSETGCSTGEAAPCEVWSDSHQVAQMLGVCERQVRNRAAELGGRKFGGRWLFPEAATLNLIGREAEKNECG